jgi:acyl-CoA synthetase (AMP-forming)/AMP-acid ligase II
MPKVMDLMENAVSGTGRIRYLPSGEEHTFTDIWADSEHSARWIHSRVGSGGAVGAILSNTPSCGAALLGTWRSGNTLVSLQQPSRGMTAERYRAQMLRIAELTGVTHVLIDAQYAALVPADLPITVVTFQDTLAGGPPCDTTGSGALIQFTSGSVGSPKGVVLSAEAIGAHILSLIEVMEPTPGDVSCSWLPLSHDMGLIGMYLTSIACLAPSILGKGVFALLSPEYFLRQPSAWLQACSEAGTTITAAPNFALELAVRARAHSGDLNLSRLRMVITGAERVSAPTLRRFADCLADAGFRPRALSPAYGMAEATLAVTMVRPGEQWWSLRIDREG